MDIGRRPSHYNVDSSSDVHCPHSCLRLAQLIREDNNIKGMIINGEDHKISLYADHVLLYLTEPTLTVPHLKEIISEFGFYSGYKVNLDKTEAMSREGKVSQQFIDGSGFKWPKDGIKYLAIYIPPSLKKMCDANYKKIIQNISNDMDRWTALPLSLLGCVESIRVNVLPRLLYLSNATIGDT